MGQASLKLEQGLLPLKSGNVPYVVERLTPPRSRRTRYTLDVKPGDGNPYVVFLAPPKVPETELVAFGLKHKRWIANRLTELAGKAEKRARFDGLQGRVCELPQAWWQRVAESWILPRTAWWASIMNEQPRRVVVTHTKSRWGSCDRHQVVRLSCWLMQVPEGLRDYVIVHELAHLRQMNHSPKFWREVAVIMPDYMERRRELAKLGRQIM